MDIEQCKLNIEQCNNEILEGRGWVEERTTKRTDKPSGDDDDCDEKDDNHKGCVPKNACFDSRLLI